jgi:hypothetical protein
MPYIIVGMDENKKKRGFLVEVTAGSIAWVVLSSVLNGVISFAAWTVCGWWWPKLKKWWNSRKKA